MPGGNVISLTPPHPGLPGQFDWAKAKPAKQAKQALKAEDSSDAESQSSDDEEAAAAAARSERRRPRSRRPTSSGGGASMWKPVFLTIACLNIIALGGLLYSAPWRPMTSKEDRASSAPGAHQVEHKLLIPVEAAITEDGKVSARYPEKFLSSAPAAIRRKLIDSLKQGAPQGQGTNQAASR